jgi:hypothetical protein
MAAGELDDRMNAFYDGKYDVLLATTIVESGLDIPPPTPWSSTAPTCSGWRSSTRSGAGWAAPRPAPMPT